MASSNVAIIEKASAGMQNFLSTITSSEAQYFDEERFSEAELRRSLNDSLCEKKIDAMKHVLAAVSVGRDAGGLFPEVVKNIVTGSLELKKLVYIYLVLYAEGNRDLALLSVNSFQKDLSDRSQLVRASALRAMASIKVLEIIQLVMMAVQKAAQDGSPYVRKTAAQCMVKVYSVDPDQFTELRELLLRLINDHEVSVVGSAVIAFHSICVSVPPKIAADESEGDGAKDADGFMHPDKVLEKQLALLHPLYKRLCQDVLLMDTWAQQHCIDLMLRYCRIFFVNPNKPRPEGAEAPKEGANGEGDEASEDAISPDFQLFLNSLKLLLNSASVGVSLCAASALCYLAPPSELPQVVTPLLRCLIRAPDESHYTFMMQMLPLIKAHPDLFRPWIREFFVKSFEASKVKCLKLQILEVLCDDSNVQLILKELQCYAHWHSQPQFVAEVVQTITKIALKISAVTDSCLRGLVKMLDSKCMALSSEAVVALRALLQQRQEQMESGLGAVVAHLVSSFEDLKAATARASVIWIIGQYQHEVSFLAPDVVRKLVKSFSTEATEVKQQALLLSVKVWVFHSLNAQKKTADEPAPDMQKPDRTKPVTPAMSAQIVGRLDQMCDYLMEISALDESWDVRDMSRGLKAIKAAAKESLAEAGPAGSLKDFSQAFGKACVRGSKLVDGDKLGPLPTRPSTDKKETTGAASLEGLHCQYTLYSLAHILDFAFETYKVLPPWATENSPDSVREVSKGDLWKAKNPDEPKSLSSANMGGGNQHMEQRVVNPSNITNLPKAECLEDLDLFYSDEPEQQAPAPGAVGGLGAPPPGAATGTAVFGEDDESDEEDAKSNDEDDLKYLQQATPQS